MKVWAVANQKGGVGKTTTAVTLGGVMARRGERTLLVDLDPHGSLTGYFGVDPDQTERTLYGLFAGDLHRTEGVVRETPFERLWFAPASTAMATLDRQLAGRDGMGLIVKRALEQVRGRFDQVLVDCPPIMGVLMVNALAAAEHLLVPVQTEFLALKGLERMERTLAMVTRARRTPLDYLIVPTMYDKRTRASRESIQALRANHASHLWPGIVPVDTRFREASRAGVPLSNLHPGARGVRAYQKLLDYARKRWSTDQEGAAAPAAIAHRERMPT